MPSLLDTMKSYICCGGVKKLQQHITGHKVGLYENLLVYAAECGELECVKLLVGYCDPDKTTAVMKAAYYGQKDCVAFLLPSPYAGHALMNAVTQEYNECLKIITPHCSPEFCAQGLKIAVERNYVFGVDFLIDYCDGYTLLHDFYNNGKINCAQRLENALARKQKNALEQGIDEGAPTENKTIRKL